MNYREVLIRLMSMTSPFVYDDEETFLEMLRKFYKYLHELTTATKELSDDMNKLRTELDSFEDDVNKILEEYSVRIDTISNNLKLYVDNSVASLQAYIDSQILLLDDKIKQIELGAINLYDPTTGLYSPLQTVIDNIYDTQRNNSLTASEYDALELTATEYDAYELTAREYDTNAKELLV